MITFYITKLEKHKVFPFGLHFIAKNGLSCKITIFVPTKGSVSMTQLGNRTFQTHEKIAFIQLLNMIKHVVCGFFINKLKETNDQGWTIRTKNSLTRICIYYDGARIKFYKICIFFFIIPCLYMYTECKDWP